jgi:hypothetical protein
MQDDEELVFNEDVVRKAQDDDSVVLNDLASGRDGLAFVRNGCCTIVKFTNKEIPDDFCMAKYRDQLYELIKDPACELLRFDLTGIPFLPSGLLGVLASVKNRGIDVEVSNPSQNIRESLAVTRLDSLIRICD